MPAKIRHIAFSVADPDASAEFLMKACGLEKVGESNNPTADGVYLSDGTISLALLRYKSDEPVGKGRTKDWVGLHHIGFWADDTDETCRDAEAAGATWLAGEVSEGEGAFYEVKYADPDGNIFDITHNGWKGAVKDVYGVENKELSVPAVVHIRSGFVVQET